VTLGRLVLAWVAVTVVFVVAAGLWPPPSLGRLWWLTGRDLSWRALEAGATTLFGSLWFDSLGSGEWWLLFLLVGIMVSLARLPGPAPRREAILRSVRDVLRYLLAGAVLAWRLG
jgi:hypothetical protein